MGCSLVEVQRRVSSPEFSMWMAYRNVEPSVSDRLERVEIMIAQLSAMYANTHKSKGARTYSAQDFILETDGDSADDAKKSPAEMRALLVAQMNRDATPRRERIC